jgi:hypothetical protein
MNDTDKVKLEILRQRIPVGLRHGLTLLEKVNGDVEQAEKLFQQEMISLVISKTGVKEDIATRHLIKNNYDINLALKSIDEESYSLTERILRRYRNKEEALTTLVSAVEREHKLVRKFWLDIEDMQKLPQEVFCLLMIMEWLLYADYEGLDNAINFYCNEAIEQIERTLQLPEIAKIIRDAKEIHESQLEAQQIKERGLNRTPEFRRQADLFNEQTPLLIDTLYEFVKKHINQFP